MSQERVESSRDWYDTVRYPAFSQNERTNERTLRFGTRSVNLSIGGRRKTEASTRMEYGYSRTMMGDGATCLWLWMLRPFVPQSVVAETVVVSTANATAARGPEASVLLVVGAYRMPSPSIAVCCECVPSTEISWSEQRPRWTDLIVQQDRSFLARATRREISLDNVQYALF